MSEQRQFYRVAIHGSGKLIQDNHEWNVDVVDISLQGLRLNVNVASLSDGIPNKPMRVVLSLNEALPELKAWVQVTHMLPATGDMSPAVSVGCKLTAISVDDIAMLRRLIMLNTGDDNLSDIELATLLAAVYDKASSASES